MLVSNLLPVVSADCHGLVVQGTTLSAQEYRVDDIKVEYPLTTGRAAEIHHFEEFHRGQATADYIPIEREPWRPFRSRIDFEFAELGHKAKLTHKELGSLIDLIHRAMEKKDQFTLTSYEDLSNCWRDASYKVTSFEKADVTLDYKSEPRSYDFYYRPIWDTALDLLRDKRIISQFVWDAQRLSKFNGTRWVRWWDEPWTGDGMWEIQEGLPEGAKPLCFFLYADKTKLSSFAGAKGYPIVLRFAQLPVEIRNGEGFGGGQVVGWLPVIPETEGDTGKPGFVNFKNAIWHESFRQLLASVEKYSHSGVWIECGDGVTRHLFPAVLILSADYEEQCVMALTRGSMSNYPCPICLVPNEEQFDLSKKWPRRTARLMKKKYEKALEMNKKDADEFLKEVGLRLVHNVFWFLRNSDPHKALSFDRLHANHGGLFSDHLFQELQNIFKSLGRAVLDLADKQMDLLPRWPGLNHFKMFIQKNFMDGTKYEDISKVVFPMVLLFVVILRQCYQQLLFAVHNFVDRAESRWIYVFLQCLRSYLELDMWAAFEVHTEETIAACEEEILKYDSLLKKYVKLPKPEGTWNSKNWSFPKNHSRGHMLEDIKAKGVTKNYNTKVSEKMHRPLKQAYLKTNFKIVDEPILQDNHRTRVATVIREDINALDVSPPADELELEHEPQKGKRTTAVEFGHIRLGSAGDIIALEQLEKRAPEDTAYKNFQKGLSKFLSSLLPAYDIELPGGKPIKLNSWEKVREYRYIRVKYESMVDWRESTDRLRCTPSFQESPRYDCVMVNTTNGTIFAKLIFCFTCKVADSSYPIALIQPFDAPTGPRRRKDKDLCFYRVKARTRSEAEFIDARSILRGALLAPDFEEGHEDEYLVMDTVDTDMFLRLKHMFPVC
ncbi:hypothetical protein GLOTRDRAFT_82536 [Gloeophyllum trabeum ATCC 11539]|uniref:Uncharacterized protein n=1 Tax=Gloeophyllum trabeum (strain ATCC 11539 / FP-39264 / Madison 617) TaxID=670483 RepID=S7PQT6_GLOTA|nr:uncharacterized protein GLOTRDRAFT_82536 [Gloeophyllum trabeum ATCC 11539]EPQ50176.1 hypothetical protein GLOTRDRAFT_82536 [Gloeophyllum trabeum ATCC 11539]